MKRNLNQRQVVGFTLAIGENHLRLTKRLFDVNVGDSENGGTTIILVSPVNRPKVWVINNKNMEEDRPKFRICNPKRESRIELSVEEWNKLKEGKVINQSDIKNGRGLLKYLTLNLDELPLGNTPKVTFEEWQIKSIIEAYIS